MNNIVTGGASVFFYPFKSNFIPNQQLGILEKEISVLAKSKSYPYGLTPHRMKKLEQGNFSTVGALVEAKKMKNYYS